ncbi:hypothetical protein RND81_10G155600 [Saponaria officinalis]|uniref:DUF3615 domain-containing protein n=1 Tax=Saponaria officinalis TaxID=3572 RepID=A0AAW1I4Z2_SAPOF
MVAATCYSLRSGCYNLRSKAVSLPSIHKLRFVDSRRVGKKPKAVKRKKDMDDITFWKFPEVEESAREFAAAALAYLNEDKDCNYELVKPGVYEGAVISGGSQFHHNFKAKRADDPSAPVETFFSQVFSHRYPSSKGLTVECCVSLGASDSLPVKRDNRGCLFCTDGVHHPIGGCKGINVGWSPDDDFDALLSEKYE